jgi:DNA-binding PadR family transcriptional regulator
MKSLPRTQEKVLALLAESGRTHAYDLKLQLRHELGHSSVYAALTGAEAKGYVVAQWEDPNDRPPGEGPLRKYYEITVAGLEALRAVPSPRRGRGRVLGGEVLPQ